MWCLTHPDVARKRFTAFQWAVLRARWIVVNHTIVRNSSVLVNETLGVKNDARREAEDAAWSMACELYWGYRRALDHWNMLKAGKTTIPLRGEERDYLSRQRKARPKKGRRPFEPPEWIAASLPDAYDVWTSDTYAGPLRRADMSEGQQMRFDGHQPDSEGLADPAGGYAGGDDDPEPAAEPPILPSSTGEEE